MNAIQFMKEHGVEKAREVVEGIPSKHMTCYYSTLCYCTKSKKYSDRFKPRESLVNMEWLKRLVESIDLVNDHGGLETIKKCVEKTIFPLSDRIIRMKQAIADYESIYKCTYCNGFGEVGCQFEGTFTCPDCNGDRYVGGEHV